ncbi:MAG: hypothetical protein RL514_4746 [Verrucomicrobiota bacterium]|jgi:hypothetical protein
MHLTLPRPLCARPPEDMAEAGEAFFFHGPGSQAPDPPFCRPRFTLGRGVKHFGFSEE